MPRKHNRVWLFAFFCLAYFFGTFIAVPEYWYLEPVKRYKQTILSDFFVAINAVVSDLQEGCDYHLVEANLDIESRDDRTLCTEVLHGEYRYEVHTSLLLALACPICSAILKRRISNMPLEHKSGAFGVENTDQEIPEAQMALFLEGNRASEKNSDETSKEVNDLQQFDLFS